MKNLIVISLLCIGCAKPPIVRPDGYYNLNNDVFRSWQRQPSNPIFVKDTYYDDFSGKIYCHCIAGQRNPDDTTKKVWEIPIEDLH